jgi:hypothetical protein
MESDRFSIIKLVPTETGVMVRTSVIGLTDAISFSVFTLPTPQIRYVPLSSASFSYGVRSNSSVVPIWAVRSGTRGLINGGVFPATCRVVSPAIGSLSPYSIVPTKL